MIEPAELAFSDNPTVLPPDAFSASIHTFSFQDKYFKWVSYLKDVKIAESQYLRAALEKFVELFPFNHTYWAELLDLILSQPKGKSNTLKMYQVALAKNPRCITLWRKYLDWLMKELKRSDPNYLRNQLESASKMIGNHFKAGFVFDYYMEMEEDVGKRFSMLKRAMVSPLQDLDRLRDHLFALIDSQQFLPLTTQLAEAQGLTAQQPASPEYLRILQEEIKQRITHKLYEPTRQHVNGRLVFEAKIATDEYIPFSDPIENWRNYISYVKHSGNSEFLPSIYERALISQCDNESLWEEYFLLLENENNAQRALYLLRSHALFFRSMSKELTYYWLQIEQRDNPQHARELYLDMEHNEYDLEIFMRHISMEMRSKDYNNVKAIYEVILTIFSSNLPIVVYTVLEYAEFCVKNFRDVAFAKKLLHNYFKSYPFHETLFVSLLQFYEKHVEIKENTKEGKEISDEFTEIVLSGLSKALDCVEARDYNRIKKIAIHHLRSYILSIYLIKIADRKIKEQEIAFHKKEANGKRPLPAINELSQPSIQGRKKPFDD